MADSGIITECTIVEAVMPDKGRNNDLRSVMMCSSMEVDVLFTSLAFARRAHGPQSQNLEVTVVYSKWLPPAGWDVDTLGHHGFRWATEVMEHVFTQFQVWMIVQSNNREAGFPSQLYLVLMLLGRRHETKAQMAGRLS